MAKESKKYNSAVSVAFEVCHDDEYPTNQEVLTAMAKRLVTLMQESQESEDSMTGSGVFDVYDTVENEDNHDS